MLQRCVSSSSALNVYKACDTLYSFVPRFRCTVTGANGDGAAGHAAVHGGHDLRSWCDDAAMLVCCHCSHQQ
jgi:hypothetical protein